jgi:amidase
MPDRLVDASAAALADRIRRREVTAAAVVDAHLERIERWNPALNALVTVDPEGARRRAREADAALDAGTCWGPLHGVPVTVKDQFATAGMRTTYGLPRYASYVPDADAPLVGRLREAGAVLLGKTSLPFAAYDWQSRHPSRGPANNPWDLARTPGGSSGGSAAALAARLVPLELGADVAGSIRVPSHFCGTCGLRPTEGRLPVDGIVPADRPRTVRHIVVAGPMARRVADLRLALGVLDGASPAAASGLPDAAAVPAADDLRIAFTPELGGVPVDGATRRVLREAVTALRAAGCTVRRRPPPFDVDDALEVWGRIQGYELNASLPAPLRRLPLREVVWEGAVRAVFGFLAGPLARGARMDARRHAAALDRREGLARTVDRFLSRWDLWITPVAGRPAFRHCRAGSRLSIDGVDVPYALPFAAYNCATAAPGHPILTLPAGRTDEGLPVGLQVHARRSADAALLAAGRRLEAILDVPPADPLRER